MPVNQFQYDLERRQRLWAKRMVSHSKYADRRAGRDYTDANYITPQGLMILRKKQRNKCYYCDVPMQTNNRREWNGLTIERIDTSRPHDYENCKLCCHTCNCKKFTGESILREHNQKYIKDRKRQSKLLTSLLGEITKFTDSRRPCFA